MPTTVSLACLAELPTGTGSVFVPGASRRPTEVTGLRVAHPQSAAGMRVIAPRVARSNRCNLPAAGGDGAARAPAGGTERGRAAVALSHSGAATRNRPPWRPAGAGAVATFSDARPT
jgi:hypothetical protein